MQCPIWPGQKECNEGTYEVGYKKLIHNHNLKVFSIDTAKQKTTQDWILLRSILVISLIKTIDKILKI